MLRHDQALQRGAGQDARGGGVLAVQGRKSRRWIRVDLRGQEGLRGLSRGAAEGRQVAERGGPGERRVCRAAGRGVREEDGEVHVRFDEAYFKTLERMQWDRDNGFIELMPIVVGLP